MKDLSKTRVRRWRINPLIMLLGLGTFFLIGCAEELQTAYLDPYTPSINGISVFRDLLRQSGRRVDTAFSLHPQMRQRYGTIIVFQTSFGPLPNEFGDKLNLLLQSGKLRDVILVVRDSDLAIDYWKQIEQEGMGTSEQQAEVRRQSAEVLSSFEQMANVEFEVDKDVGYGLKNQIRNPDNAARSVLSTIGDQEHEFNVQWRLNRRLVPSDNAVVVWASGDDPLMVRCQKANGRVTIVASATPLLNGGIVDSGNRELATELINQLPADDPIAIVLSARWIDKIEDEESSSFKLITVHPNGWIFGQAILAITLFCWWKFPIFGRPRSTPELETTRFGRHVEALGRLLKRSGDKSYALSQIEEWKGTEKSSLNGQSEVEQK